MEYLSLLINFFKSYKVQFLDIGGTLIFNNEMDDSSRPNDRLTGIDIELSKGDTYNTLDEISSLEVELEEEDSFYTEDSIEIQNEYDNIFFDLNGDKSTEKLSYIILDGSKYTVDGFKAPEDDYRIDVEDIEEELIFDGGSSDCLCDDSFFDLDGVDAVYVEEEDNSYEEVDDWDGGSSSFNITEYVMDNGTAVEQKFYADYCPNDRDYRFPDEVNYNPEYQGYTCNGRYAEEEIWYWQGNAMYAEPLDDTRYEIDGGRSYTMDSDMYIAYLEYLNSKNEEAHDINIAITEQFEYYKVNPIYEYNIDFDYYTLNQFTGEFELIKDITAANYQSYVASGIYYPIQCAIMASEALLVQYEGYTLDDLWEEFTNITSTTT